jgi:hypothetical protein
MQQQQQKRMGKIVVLPQVSQNCKLFYFELEKTNSEPIYKEL